MIEDKNIQNCYITRWVCIALVGWGQLKSAEPRRPPSPFQTSRRPPSPFQTPEMPQQSRSGPFSLQSGGTQVRAAARSDLLPAPPPRRDLAAAAAMPLGDGMAGDFALPDELLAALPRDPYEQLDLARRITAMAVSGRVSGLEREAARLRAEASVRDRENGERVALLDAALKETNGRLRDALEDNVGFCRLLFAFGGPAWVSILTLASCVVLVQIKLSKERDSLSQTCKKQARDLQKVGLFDPRFLSLRYCLLPYCKLCRFDWITKLVV
jgi:hypothetical protein